MNLKELVSQYQAFIFDFDGVIVDSLAIKADAFAELFSDLGVDVMKQVKAHHLSHGGVSRYEKFKHYFREVRHRDITADESVALDQQYSKLVVQQVIEADAIPGVMEFLALIKASGKFCCVVSATPQAEIRHIVQARQMSEFFKEVLGSPNSKKDNVGRILQDYRLEATQTIYFGDAKSDYEAAKQYGIDFVGVIKDQESELREILGLNMIANFQS